jgi:hypothetical protein
MLNSGTSLPKKRCTTSGLMKRRAKNAITTLGTEASVSRIGEEPTGLGACVFGQVEGGAEAEWCRNDHRDHRHHQRAGEDRPYVEQVVAREPASGPKGSEVHLGEELGRSAGERRDDRHADDDREEAAPKNSPRITFSRRCLARVPHRSSRVSPLPGIAICPISSSSSLSRAVLPACAHPAEGAGGPGPSADGKDLLVLVRH